MPGRWAICRRWRSAFVGIAQDAGLAVKFQVGEPWWWVMADGRLCIHDDAARAALGDPAEQNVRGDPDIAVLDAAGALLAASTAALGAAVRGVAPAEAQLLLLAYLPTVLDRAAPELMRANLPVGWAYPAFDVLQLEDYDWAAAGNAVASARGVALARRGWAIRLSAALFRGVRAEPGGCAAVARDCGSGGCGACAGRGGDVHLGAAAGDPRWVCDLRSGG
jgi:hypothetical protein